MEELFEEFQNLIYSLSFKLTGNREEADNLFQETWLQVVKNYHSFDPQLEARNWLYTICLNCYRQQYKKEKRSWTHQQTYRSAEAMEQALIRITDREELPDEALETSERKNIVREIILTLQPAYRLPIVLYYYEQLSYLEISAVMELPLSTVKYRLNRAKKLIKSRMEAYKDV